MSNVMQLYYYCG